MTTASDKSNEPLVFSLEEPVEIKVPAERIEAVAALESMTNLLKKITAMWGTRDLEKFIQSLFMDSRDGARQGFPQAVAQELILVAECNKMLRAIETSEKLGIGLADAHRMIESGDQAFVTGGSGPWDDPSSSGDGLSRDDSIHREKNRKSSLHQPIPVQSLNLGVAKSESKGPVFWLCIVLIALAIIQFGMQFFGNPGGSPQ